MSLSDEPIVILGTFRSGTSAMATAYSHLGIYFGREDDFQPADEFNKGGYWELKDAQALNARIYTAYGTNYYQVDRFPEDWDQMPYASALVQEIRNLLRGKFSGKGRWGFKEPATSVLLPLYKEAMVAEGVRNPRYVIAVRHPLSVAASQNKRQSQWGYQEAQGTGDGVAPVEERTIGLWTHYTLSSLRSSVGSVRQVVSYEGFLANASRSLRWMADHLSEPKPTTAQMDAAVLSVRPEWSHSRYTVEDLKEWSPVVMGTYDVCQRADKDPDGLNEGKYDAEIEQLWSEWLQWSKMVRPIDLPAGQMLFHWQVGSKRESHSERFTPSGAWQTVRFSLPIEPGADVLIDPYQMPSQIWIRNATWHVGGSSKKATLNPGPGGMLGEAFGTKRLTLFGPGALIGQVPPGAGPVEFEMEFMVQAGQVVMSDIVTTLRNRVEQLRRSGGQPGFNAGQRR